MPEHLLYKLINNECILFVGAGISKKCITDGRKSLPNWYEFLYEFINWVSKKKNLESEYIDDLLQLLDEQKYLIVAEELLANIDIIDFKRYLDESFNAKNIVPSRLHKLIALLPFRGILTTNYDNLIELSLVAGRKKVPNIFTNNDILNGINPLEKDFFILKMHGDIEEPASIVLSYKSYLKMMHESPIYQKLIESIFSKYTVLFIGYGNADKNIEFLLDKLSVQSNSNKHYILSEKGSFSEIEKNRYRQDRKLEIIEYIDYFKLHNHIDTFFDDMASDLVEKKVLQDTRPKTLRTLIKVFYDDVDMEDGLYLWQYIFKEGAVTLSLEAQLKQYENFKSDSIKKLLITKFIIFYLGELDLTLENSYIQKIEKILKTSIKHECQFIFLSLEKNKSIIEKKYNFNTVFYVRKNFIDSDLEIMKDYIIQRI